MPVSSVSSGWQGHTRTKLPEIRRRWSRGRPHNELPELPAKKREMQLGLSVSLSLSLSLSARSLCMRSPRMSEKKKHSEKKIEASELGGVFHWLLPTPKARSLDHFGTRPKWFPSGLSFRGGSSRTSRSSANRFRNRSPQVTLLPFRGASGHVACFSLVFWSPKKPSPQRLRTSEPSLSRCRATAFSPRPSGSFRSSWLIRKLSVPSLDWSDFRTC